jgi:hypothetical protein
MLAPFAFAVDFRPAGFTLLAKLKPQDNRKSSVRGTSTSRNEIEWKCRVLVCRHADSHVPHRSNHAIEGELLWKWGARPDELTAQFGM